MKTCNHTTEPICCLPFNDYQLTISQILQLNLSNSPSVHKACQLIESTRRLFNAKAAFTHVLHEKYLMFRTYSGINAAQSLQYACHSARVIAKQSMLLTQLEKADGWYTGIPVRNHEGRIVLILSMIHTHAISELPGYKDFTLATLAYLEWMLSSDSQNLIEVE